MKNRFRICLSVILSCACLLPLLLFSACGKDDVHVVYLGVPNTAGTFDPQVASDTAARIIDRSIFEGLTALDAAGKAVPAAALGWEVSPDGLTYTFRLRPGDKWHLTSNAVEALEGKLPAGFSPAVTADDFVFGLRRAVDPAMGAPDAALLANIENAAKILEGQASPDTLGVSAPDPSTVVIRLVSPQPDLPETLAEPLCMPCCETFFNATGGRYGLLIKYLLSNGPFYLTRFDETSYRLARNPDYAGPLAPRLDFIWFYVRGEESRRVAELRQLELDGAYISEDSARSLSGARGSTVISLHDVLRCILVNPADPVLSQPKLRAAFFAAASLDVLCRSAGFERVYNAYPGAVGAAAARAEEGGDAQTLLAEGLAAAERDTVSLTLLCEQQYEAALKAQLQIWQEKLGIRMNLNVSAVEPSALAAAVSSGGYQLAFAPVTAQSPDAWDWFVRFTKEGKNSVLPLEDKAFSAALDGLIGGSDVSALDRADRALLNTHTVLPVWEESNCFYCAPGVTGVIVLPGADRLYLYAADAAH